MGEWIDQGQGPMVQVVMGIHNGAPFLPEQLKSLAAQRGVRWQLTCSDDNSVDNSREVLHAFGRRHPGRVQICAGPGRGFAANYLTLLAGLPKDDIPVALADQDDVWLPGKLGRALRALERVPPGVPALYTAQRWVWTPTLGITKAERRRIAAPAFRNALIENIAPGNTIVLNAAAASLARQAAPLATGIFAHDWWLYQLITGAGGQVICDPARVVLYRQHPRNAIGAGQGAFISMTRKLAVLRGVYRARLTAQTAGLAACRPFLCPSSLADLERFSAARSQHTLGRLRAMAALRPYRQSPWSSAAFWGAITLGKA
ncbi:glycosyltransferase [Rhodobacteraceae bacterium KMM 6894]|nr:glycosyltransferase [Rhodobacteraceae bacterium KMM 6894]